MENEKINIYVPEYVGDILDNDASMFEVLKNDGDCAKYYFKCSEDQVFLYFRRFLGTTAEVLSPSSLRKRMQDSFMNNLSMYER